MWASAVTLQQLTDSYPKLPDVGNTWNWIIALVGVSLFVTISVLDLIFEWELEWDTRLLFFAIMGLGVFGGLLEIPEKIQIENYKESVWNEQKQTWDRSKQSYIDSLPKEKISVLEIGVEEGGVRVLLDTDKSYKTPFISNFEQIKNDPVAEYSYVEASWVPALPDGTGEGWYKLVLHYAVNADNKKIELNK